MDGMTNGDGMQIVMLLYDVDGFSDEEPFILCDYGVRNEKCVRCEGVMTGHDALKMTKM